MRHLARLLGVVALFFLSACGGSDDAPLQSPLASGIGPAGGTVTGPGGSQVVVPPNALATNVALQIAQSGAGAPSLPAERTAVGDIFAFTPHGTAFAVPATVTVPFNAALLSGGEAPQLWKTNTAQTGWEPVAGGTVAGSSMSGSVASFSWFVVTRASTVAPSIIAQPGDSSVIVGQSATFSVTATGTAPLNYQWKRDGAEIPGATAADYTLGATAAADNGARFAVVVSNSAGSAMSNEATLTVSSAAIAPTITTQPASVTVTAGQPASFNVVASGTEPLSYQWKLNGNDIAGANGSSYVLATTALSDNGGLFSVTVSNPAGNVTSAAATLTVTSTAGSIGTPTRLDTRAATLDATRVRLVMDAAGNATAVWAQNLASGTFLYGIFASRFDAAANQWGAEVRLDTNDPSVTSRTGPNAAVDGSGTVFVSWIESGRMLMTRYLGSWTAPAVVMLQGATAPASIATDTAGNALLLFTADDPLQAGGQSRMNFSRYDVDIGGFTAPFAIESYSGSLVDSSPALIAANSGGNAIAVWVRGDALAAVTVFARYSASTRTWSAPVSITAPSPAGLTFDDDGNGLLLAGNGLWRYTGSTNAFTRSGGIPSGANITNFNTQLGNTGNGRAVAVSIDSSTGATALIARDYDPTTDTWSSVVQIAEVLANNFKLGTAPNGEAAVVFERSGVFASRRPSGSAVWHPVQRINRDSVSTNLVTGAAGILTTGRLAGVWAEVDSALGFGASDVWGNVVQP